MAGTTVKVPEKITPQPTQPGLYSEWASAAAQSPYHPPNSTTPVQSLNASGQVVSATPDSTTPEAPQSSFNNVPVYQLINPAQAPSAWNITDPSADIFVANTDATKMGHNQIIGAIADKLGIKHKASEKEPTLEAAVMARLVKEHNIKPPAPGENFGQPPSAGDVKSIDRLKGNPNPPIPIKGGTGLKGKNAPQLDAGAIVDAMHLTVVPGQDPWEAIANRIGVNTSVGGKPQTVKAAQAAEAIRAVLTTPAQIAALQSQLEAAGLFTAIQQPGSSEAYTPGNFDTATNQAFGTLLDMTAAANKEGKHVSWQDTLNAAIATTTAAGGPDAVLKRATVRDIPQATMSQMESPALTAFEARLGRAPTAAELQQLTGAYDVQQQKKYASMTPGTPVFNDQQGIPSLAGLATPTAFAGQAASAGSPNEAFGHSIANAAAMLANIIGASPGSQNILGTTNPSAAETPL